MLPETALPTAGLAASIGVGVIFLTAGIEKLRHRVLLPGVIANYRLLPDALVNPAATLLPLVEVALGATLLVGLSPVPVVLGVALLLVFAAAMAINIGRGRSAISCGCGRPELRQTLDWTLVARNLVLAALLGLGLPAQATPISLLDLSTAIGAGLALALLYSLLNAIGSVRAAALASARR